VENIGGVKLKRIAKKAALAKKTSANCLNRRLARENIGEICANTVIEIVTEAS